METQRMRLARVITMFVVFFTTVVVNGATAFSGFVGFGSIENAINLYAVPNSKVIFLGVYQETDDGYTDVKMPWVRSIDFKTKNELDQYFRDILSFMAKGSLTNSLVDRDKSFRIFSYTTRYNEKLGNVVYLYHSSEFHLIKSEEGRYSLPDFSQLTMRLPHTMLFEIPGLVWGRIEGRRNPSLLPYNDDLIYKVDSRIEEPDVISISESYIQIPTDIAISGTTGPTLVKISLVVRQGSNYTFRVYGPLGTRIPETPNKIVNFQALEDQVSFDIVGGDTGRVLKIQCAPSPLGPWKDVGENLVVSQDFPLHIQRDNNGAFGYYRTQTVDIPP